MAREKPSTLKEGRPHVNLKTIQHRQLLQPGPGAKLRIKASPYQDLACGPSKRKADSPTVDLASTANHDDSQQLTEPKPVQPIKALKVIHHRFFNGNTGEIRSSETSDDDFQPGENKDCARATPTYLMYMNGTGQWRFTRDQFRKNDHKTMRIETLNDDDHVLKPRINLNYYPHVQAPDLVSDEQAATPQNDEPTHSLNARSKIGEKYTSGEKSLSNHAPSNDSVSGHLERDLTSRPQNFDPGLLSNDLHNKDFEDNGFDGISGPSHKHMRNLAFEHSIQQASANNHLSNDLTGSSTYLNQLPLLSMREMVLSLYPKLEPPSQVLHQHHDQAAKTGSDQSDQAAQASGRSSVVNKEDASAPESSSSAPVSDTPPISPIARGKVWESRATRLARRRQEAALARSDPSTPNVAMTNGATGAYSAVSSNGTEGYPAPSTTMTGTSCPPHTNPSFDRTTTNATTNDNIDPTLTAAPPPPPRFLNQNTNCLICLRPVTTIDLELADLRCSACPRTFHAHCLTYIPPRMNQNWRCSLCYKEAWLGYGELAAEQDFDAPKLVERYRRRLLVAKTYAFMAEEGGKIGREMGNRADNVRFWFDVDMDGSAESDQAVLVGMGIANTYKLRLLGEEEGVEQAVEVERVERWGIALGMALQEEEAKVEELRAEVEGLRLVLQQRDREIEELESGL